jgi:hypothetical protein
MRSMDQDVPRAQAEQLQFVEDRLFRVGGSADVRRLDVSKAQAARGIAMLLTPIRASGWGLPCSGGSGKPVAQRARCILA